MLADLMPRWLFKLLRMDTAVLPYDGPWTWRHFCRYGYDVARIADSERRYRERTDCRPRPTPWIFRGNNGEVALAVLCLIGLAMIWL